MAAAQPIYRGLDGVQAPPPVPAAKPATVPPRVDGQSFGQVLQERLAPASGLRFSGHAIERIQRRGIQIDDNVLTRLQDGVARAAAKGSRESLVMLDDTAFVVSIRNRTVVTAVDRDHMKEQVFTNIDSAVIA
jgi:flagellar operon protein